MILVKKLFNTSEAFEKVRKGQGNGERGGARVFPFPAEGCIIKICLRF